MSPRLAVAVCLLGPLAAQTPSPDNAGCGAIYQDFALDPKTGNVLHLGVAVSSVTGHVFVSAAGPLGAPPHVLYEFDPHGVLLGTVLQPAAQNASPLGMRDLEFDGQSILGGSEVGISVCSPGGALVNQLLAANGPQPIAQPIGGAALAQLGTLRALAFDPHGNGGNGSLLVADFGSPILECDLQGNVLRTTPNGGWSAYGLAVDPVTGNLWVNADLQGNLAEIDRASGLLTGHVLAPVLRDALAGGLSVASGVAGHHERWPAEFVLAHVAQAATGDDHVGIQRVHLYPGLLGFDEPVLRIGTNGGALARGIASFTTGDRLDLRAGSPTGRLDGQPCWTFANFAAEAGLDGYTDLSPVLPGAGLLREFRCLTALSTPATAVYGLLGHTLGAPASILLPPPLRVAAGELLRLQTVYLEPQSPQVFGATNEGNFVGAVVETGIVVAAAGPNSFQMNPATPFWTIRSDSTHAHGAILSVEISFASASGPGALQRFDIDQLGMNDRFDGGNSSLPGAHGTYRGGSDQLCGLDYAAPGVYVDPVLHTQPGESCGAAVTLLPGFVLDASSLLFRFTAFTPGHAFLFDCDTDGGPPSGDGQAGAIVRVMTANSGLLVGALQVDPTQPDRAVVFFP